MASEDLLKKAVAAFNALSPEQQAEMLEEQRQSWVRGNVGLSRDERGMTSPMMRALKIVRETNDKGRQALQAWADSKTRPTPVAPVSPDATGTVQTFNQIIDYVMRYGGRCRDCADEDGICPTNGTPCEPKVKRAVIEHTLKSLEYGLSHGFIENPFSISKPDATGKCGELERYDLGYIGPDGFILPYKDGDYVRFDQAVELLAADRAKLTKEEADHTRSLEERDRYHDVADKLAHAIADRYQSAIGEHSSINDPWQNALKLIEADNAALTARVKRLEELEKYTIPIHADGSHVFIDGPGDVELDHGGKMRQRIKALETQLAAAEKIRIAAIELDAAISDDFNIFGAQQKLRAALGGKPS